MRNIMELIQIHYFDFLDYRTTSLQIQTICEFLNKNVAGNALAEGASRALG